MSLKKTEAVILKTFNWSESSRTVVFFTREYGKLALIDKGGRSFKSKRARMMPFAVMELTFYLSEKKDARGYISEADIVDAHPFDKDGMLGRLAYGSAACELLYLLLPEEETQESLYIYFVDYIKFIDASPKKQLPALFLTFFLRTLSHMGYHPSLAYCLGCNKELDEFDTGAKLDFSPERGGFVCPTCQMPGDYYIGLSSEQARALVALQQASLKEAALLPIGYKDAGLMIETLAKFLSYQAEIKTDLKSLEFLEKLRRSQLNDMKD